MTKNAAILKWRETSKEWIVLIYVSSTKLNIKITVGYYYSVEKQNGWGAQLNVVCTNRVEKLMDNIDDHVHNLQYN